MAFPVNPHEGQVAIPFTEAPGGYVVGVLGARAIRWVEEALGEGFDFQFEKFARSMQVGSTAGVSYRSAATIVWAGLEHHRRKTSAPGPEWTLDRVDDIADEVGRDVIIQKAWALMWWSLSGRSMRDQSATAAADAGMSEDYEAGLGELEALATGGTGTPSSAPPSEPESLTTPSGT